MRVLCDENVATKYRQVLQTESGFRVSTVRANLARDASDRRIAEFAAANEWVVLTTDQDFFEIDLEFGLVVYSQLDDPAPGQIVDALVAIDAAYGRHELITEVVPDGWV